MAVELIGQEPVFYKVIFTWLTFNCHAVPRLHAPSLSLPLYQILGEYKSRE